MNTGDAKERQFLIWAKSVDSVSLANSFNKDQIIDTWPEDIKEHYPPLTVGAALYAAHCVKNYIAILDALDDCIEELESLADKKIGGVDRANLDRCKRILEKADIEQ